MISGAGAFNEANSANDGDIILDFFAGSGTTAHAVMALNAEDGGNRTCILVTNNEVKITENEFTPGVDESGELDPKGVAVSVTAKRLKRICSGKCYDGSTDFEWIKKNKPFKDNLLVLKVAKVDKFTQESGENVLEKIDETLYKLPKFSNTHEKAAWVNANFKDCAKECESDGEFKARMEKKRGK